MIDIPSAGFPHVGARVEILDGSEAQGDKGVVWSIDNGVCLVELDAGCIWPVTETWEVRVIDEK